MIGTLYSTKFHISCHLIQVTQFTIVIINLSAGYKLDFVFVSVTLISSGQQLIKWRHHQHFIVVLEKLVLIVFLKIGIEYTIDKQVFNEGWDLNECIQDAVFKKVYLHIN